MKLKILHVTNIPSPFLSHQYEILERLLKGHDFQSIFFSDGAHRSTWGKLEWYKTPLANGNLLWKNIHELLNSYNPDVLLIGGYGLKILRKTRKWSVSNNKKYYFVNCEIPSPANELKSLFRRHYLCHITNKASGISSVGPTAMREYTKIVSCPVVSAPYAFTSETLNRISSQRRYPQTNNVTFLFSGGLTQRRNPLLLIEALKIVVNDYKKQAKVVISGVGPLKKELINCVKEYDLSDYVSFIDDFKDWWDLHHLYKNADVLVSPNDFSTWNLTIQEGMIAGMPIIATCTTTSALDLVIHGYNGQLIPPGDPQALASAMAEYLGSPNLLESHGTRSAEISKTIHPEISAKSSFALLARQINVI